MLDTNYYILGGQAYPLSRYLLESYPKRGLKEVYFKKSPIALISVLILNLQSRKLFNRTLNSVRSSIKRAFGRLENSFRRMKFLHMIRLDPFPSVIFSSCCLHNFVLEVDGTDEYDKYDIEDEEEQKDEDLDHNE